MKKGVKTLKKSLKAVRNGLKSIRNQTKIGEKSLVKSFGTNVPYEFFPYNHGPAVKTIFGPFAASFADHSVEIVVGTFLNRFQILSDVFGLISMIFVAYLFLFS